MIQITSMRPEKKPLLRLSWMAGISHSPIPTVFTVAVNRNIFSSSQPCSSCRSRLVGAAEAMGRMFTAKNSASSTTAAPMPKGVNPRKKQTVIALVASRAASQTALLRRALTAASRFPSCR